LEPILAKKEKRDSGKISIVHSTKRGLRVPIEGMVPMASDRVPGDAEIIVCGYDYISKVNFTHLVYYMASFKEEA